MNFKNQPRKIVLITGVSGQDGQLLIKKLASTQSLIIGTTRTKPSLVTLRSRYKMYKNICFEQVDLNNSYELSKVIEKHQPTHIYHLSAQSSVGKSFINPLETEKSIIDSTFNILDCIKHDADIKLFNFVSSECFGECDTTGANEKTFFKPKSPYANAKVSSAMLLEMYRRKFGVQATNIFLFNHESELRSSQFVTHKIVLAAKMISLNKENILTLGNLDIHRDWVWAPDVIDFLIDMQDRSLPKRLVLGNGAALSLRDFVKEVFSQFDLSYEKYLNISPDLMRPHDIKYSKADPFFARSEFGWNPKVSGLGVARKLADFYKTGGLGNG